MPAISESMSRTPRSLGTMRWARVGHTDQGSIHRSRSSWSRCSDRAISSASSGKPAKSSAVRAAGYPTRNIALKWPVARASRLYPTRVVAALSRSGPSSRLVGRCPRVSNRHRRRKASHERSCSENLANQFMRLKTNKTSVVQQQLAAKLSVGRPQGFISWESPAIGDSRSKDRARRGIVLVAGDALWPRLMATGVPSALGSSCCSPTLVPPITCFPRPTGWGPLIGALFGFSFSPVGHPSAGIISWPYWPQ